MARAGVKTAYMWYSAGARTLEDVLAGKGGIKLTSQQEIGIRYYDGRSAFPPPRGTSQLGSYLPFAHVLVSLPLTRTCHISLTDINERMPRSEVTAVFQQIKRIGRYSPSYRFHQWAQS